MTQVASSVPRVICHRGASAYAPENTLAAIRKAAEMGGKWVEFDAKLTRDNHVIIMHDDDLGRTTNGSGKVAEQDWKDIQHLDAGSWFGDAFRGEPIPTLSATIALLARLGLGANVEIKPCPGRDEETAHIVAALLMEEWPDSLPPPLLSSFSRQSLAVAQKVAPRFARALLISRVTPDWRAHAEALGCAAVHTNQKYLGPDQAKEIHESGMAMRAYTVNDRYRAETLFGWGVDGVFTDFFDRLASM